MAKGARNEIKQKIKLVRNERGELNRVIKEKKKSVKKLKLREKELKKQLKEERKR